MSESFTHSCGHRHVCDPAPTDPETPQTADRRGVMTDPVEAAWAALLAAHDDAAVHCGFTGWAYHRRVIEDAVRAGCREREAYDAGRLTEAVDRADVVPTGDAGLDVGRLLDAGNEVAEASGTLIHWDVDAMWWELPQGPVAYLNAVAAEYARLSSSDTGGRGMRIPKLRDPLDSKGLLCTTCGHHIHGPVCKYYDCPCPNVSTDPETPQTAAGRRFVERHGTGKAIEVAAIEAEARAARDAEIRARIEAMPALVTDHAHADMHPPYLERAAVLAILDADTDR